MSSKKIIAVVSDERNIVHASPSLSSQTRVPKNGWLEEECVTLIEACSPVKIIEPY